MITKEFLSAYLNGEIKALTESEKKEMARMLLAVMEQEPVAWDVKGILCHSLEEAGKYVGTPEPLYAAPQPAPVVPDAILNDEKEMECNDGWADSFRGGWNACRAAILNGGKS